MLRQAVKSQVSAYGKEWFLGSVCDYTSGGHVFLAGLLYVNPLRH